MHVRPCGEVLLLLTFTFCCFHSDKKIPEVEGATHVDVCLIYVKDAVLKENVHQTHKLLRYVVFDI